MEHVSTIGYAGVGSYWSTRFSWFTALNRIKSCSGPSIEQTCLFDTLFVYVFHSSSMISWKKTNTFSGSAVFGCPDIGTQRHTTSALLRRLMQFLANQRALTGLLRGHWNWLRALFHQSNIFVLNRAKSKVSQWEEKNVLLKVHGYVIVKSLFSQPFPVTLLFHGWNRHWRLHNKKKHSAFSIATQSWVHHQDLRGLFICRSVGEFLGLYYAWWL